MVSAQHSIASLKRQHGRLILQAPACMVINHLDGLVEGDALLNQLYRWRYPLLSLGDTPELEAGLQLAHAEHIQDCLVHNIEEQQSIYFGAASTLA